MSHFTEIKNLPTYALYNDLLVMLKLNIISWKNNQICLNTIPSDPTNIHLGVGSLWYDWDKVTIVKDEYGIETVTVPERVVKLKETDFTTLAEPFRNTAFEDVYNALTDKFILGRMRIMKSEPKTCLTWHIDDTKRVHYPLKTQEGCFMVIDDEIKHLPANTWWLTDTLHPHTAFNGSGESRIHIVVEIVSER